ncbi:MAG: hypothetical protein ACR5LD_10045 [Symbiopectobacterium sp.]
MGQPMHLHQREGRGFAVIAYGKLGDWELGYSSDLDLVFLLDYPYEVVTDGECNIDGRQFYLRLTQRVVHLFSTRTSFSGILHEIDTRLRPSGAARMLVSTAWLLAIINNIKPGPGNIRRWCVHAWSTVSVAYRRSLRRSGVRFYVRNASRRCSMCTSAQNAREDALAFGQ